MSSITYDAVEPNVWIWHEDNFRLEMWDTCRFVNNWKPQIGYRFYDFDFDKLAPVFAGEDYGCSPLHAIDSLDSVFGLLGFLSVGKGDTDAEYFWEYTPRQLEWRDSQRREELGLLVYDHENPENEE